MYDWFWIFSLIVLTCLALPWLTFPSLLFPSFLNHSYVNASFIGEQACLRKQKRLAFLDQPVSLSLDGLGTASARLRGFLGSSRLLLLASWLGFWLAVYRAITVSFHLHYNVPRVSISKHPSYAIARSPAVSFGTIKAGKK